ncbi:MAG: hypothetical protein ACKOE6_01240, partial [Flammeovirgaceae bacterium]
MKTILSIILAWLAFGATQAQFKYERKVETASTSSWHEIQLPNSVLAKLSSGFGDIRLISDNEQETPYLLRMVGDQIQQTDVSLQPFNIVKKNGDLYFTIKTTSNETTNRATISLNNSNYDCIVTIEGSHDEKEWFTIADSMRVIAIDDRDI